MIFACPSCSASHFKPDAEAKAGVVVTCRRCKAKFRVTAAGVDLLPTEEQALDEPTTGGPTTGGPTTLTGEPARAGKGDSGFEGMRTHVMTAVPQALAAGGLADALEPEPADADMIETVESGEPIESSDVAAGEPIASASPIASGSAIDTGMPIAGASAIATSTTADEATVGDDASPFATDMPEPISNESTAAASYQFGGPTELLQGPLLAALQAEASGHGRTGALPLITSPEAERLPYAFESAKTETEGDPAGTRIESSPVFDAEADLEPEPAPVIAAQPRSASESESGAGTFEPIAAPPRDRKLSVDDKAPDFPRGAIRTYMRDVGRYYANGPIVRKLTILTILALPLALLILGIISMRGAKPMHVQWVTAPVAMWSGPAAQRGYALVDTLVRGEEVIALDQMWGEYALVRDVWGRVGYVHRESLTEQRPLVTPESSFPGCRQAPIETDKEPCEARSRLLHDACGATCVSDARCLQRCQDRFAECIDGCKTRLTVPAPAVAPTTSDALPEGAAAAAEEEVVDPTEAKAVEAEKPAKPVKATKPTKPVKKQPVKKTTSGRHR